MADVSGLRDKVHEFGARLHDAALTELEQELDAIVPDSGEPSEDKLRESRQVVAFQQGDTFVAIITYTSFKAELTEHGTGPHEIFAPAPGPPLSWVEQGERLFARYVNHPGSHKHDGWFSTTVQQWPAILERASSQVSV